VYGLKESCRGGLCARLRAAARLAEVSVQQGGTAWSWEGKVEGGEKGVCHPYTHINTRTQPHTH